MADKQEAVDLLAQSEEFLAAPNEAARRKLCMRLPPYPGTEGARCNLMGGRIPSFEFVDGVRVRTYVSETHERLWIETQCLMEMKLWEEAEKSFNQQLKYSTKVNLETMSTILMGTAKLRIDRLPEGAKPGEDEYEGMDSAMDTCIRAYKAKQEDWDPDEVAEKMMGVIHSFCRRMDGEESVDDLLSITRAYLPILRLVVSCGINPREHVSIENAYETLCHEHVRGLMEFEDFALVRDVGQEICELDTKLLVHDFYVVHQTVAECSEILGDWDVALRYYEDLRDFAAAADCSYDFEDVDTWEDLSKHGIQRVGLHERIARCLEHKAAPKEESAE
mmetsp:Transcript_9330/g.34939  ORF Transcript_9330/g.34939 Transcript_9330/m.34939 type:complete len:334 (-) Transcript_9330:132-1133(-)